MDVVKIEKSINRRRWEEIILERRQSPLSTQQFCKERGIAVSTFYKNQRKYKEALCEAAGVNEDSFTSGTFVQLPVVPEEVPSSRMVIHKDGFTIELSEDTKPEVIKALIGALR